MKKYASRILCRVYTAEQCHLITRRRPVSTVNNIHTPRASPYILHITVSKVCKFFEDLTKYLCKRKRHKNKHQIKEWTDKIWYSKMQKLCSYSNFLTGSVYRFVDVCFKYTPLQWYRSRKIHRRRFALK